MSSADEFDLDEILSKHETKPSEASKPELALLYSRPGGGKTWMAASTSLVPDLKRTLILDTEGSTKGTLSDFDDERVKIIDCRKATKIESFVFLNTILNKFFDPKAKHSYDAVVIDTFDIAQEWALAYFEDKAPVSRSGEKDGFAMWGSVKEWSLDVATNLKRIKPFGILLVHEKEEKDKDGALTTRLNMLGSAKDILPGIPDMVVYLQRKLESTEGGGKEEVTYGYFASEDGKVTKNRFKFPPVVRNPSFDKLFKYIEDRKKEKN